MHQRSNSAVPVCLSAHLVALSISLYVFSHVLADLPARCHNQFGHRGCRCRTLRVLIVDMDTDFRCCRTHSSATICSRIT